MSSAREKTKIAVSQRKYSYCYCGKSCDKTKRWLCFFASPHKPRRSIQKVAKTLPKSPRKRKEVISALVKKFKLRIKPTQSKTGRPKNELTESEKEWLKNFLDKPDITYVTPGWKDHRYVGKVDGKSQYVQKRYWTLNDLLNIANGSSLIKNESSFEFSFGKEIKFNPLYEYIKSNREYVCNRYSTVVLPLQNMRKCLFCCKSFE